jgi:transcriptional antiterminator Rof (Rho-off)
MADSDSSDYTPVACSFYDELGLRMMRGQACTLVVGEEDASQTVEGVIEDVYTEGDAEYVRLDDGRRIRLDLIQQVDDVTRPGAC